MKPNAQCRGASPPVQRLWPRVRPALCLSSVVIATMLVSACRGQTSAEPPIVPIRNMHDQPRYDPLAASPFFQDGRAMRRPPKYAVAREMPVDISEATGRRLDGRGWVAEIPSEVIRRARGMDDLLVRGKERYAISCAPCHGYDGAGKGSVPTRAKVSAFQPPTFHDERLRHLPDGQLFATITNGIRSMPGYAHSVTVQDRWAIVAYVRALQLRAHKEKLAMGEGR